MFAATAFFERTYREAFELLRESRDYLAFCKHRDLRGLAPRDQLRFSRESTRLTARLTDVMAWLLVQRALAAGEIEAAEAAASRNRLLRHAVCLDTAGAAEGRLPSGLMSLLERSYRLYVRIARLDELVARGAG